ncbi:MAG TPA: LytTR family DNA-binding domain-containing protein [Rhizomicrobium sp.]|jgi:two-component system LytT family response regulator
MIRAVIVDDVALARERVRQYLADESDIAIAGEAANGADAVRLIASLAPDLAFLDIQLPDFDGFEIVKRLPEGTRPVVIYLTAHDDKAIKAFEVQALDYLLKPFDRERFQRALNRARAQLGTARTAEPVDYLKRLAIKEKDRTDVIDTADVDYIDIAGHYLCAHVGKQVHLIRGTLSDLEARLDPARFARIHRSAIVALDRVKSLSPRRNGDCDLHLKDGGKLLLSRTYRDSLRAKLGLAEL